MLENTNADRRLIHIRNIAVRHSDVDAAHVQSGREYLLALQNRVSKRVLGIALTLELRRHGTLHVLSRQAVSLDTQHQ